ncbi:DNA polymerase III subunit epsilon [Luteimonas sp. SX5]|uniref:DNA polymerase III subunit epsilon n=1 Tax=Luteimonas galliterrae TaxID=2940486 RepID=A0ABT0MGP3_9GAMM|nr:DNA polymerase III subunit epsilon [Luteimonas galliterrae]MCL1634051.1 DNA polymerase III subunit epsilon [Luteimonas galliterrae]
MRQIVLDTETTGLSWEKGNRVVEIGCVELFERRPTGRTFHCYLNPECEFEPGAQEVTGLTLEFLADKPKFADIAEDFLAFIEGAELVIHNAAFDVGFLDSELARLGPQYGRVRERAAVEDSLELARQRYPGQRNSLDALCKRLGVDNSHRQLHGALLDAQLLAEAYLALTSGQSEIGFDSLTETVSQVVIDRRIAPELMGARPRVHVDEAELAAHEARLAAIRARAGACVWDSHDDVAVAAADALAL